MHSNSNTASHNNNVIYDIGSNNGDDIPYYLLKAQKVVAVEANPVLAQQIRERFQPHLASGRLVVENCVVTPLPTTGTVSFYLNRECHLQSQLGKPAGAIAARFDEVQLPARDISSIIEQHGDPYYLKSDIEGHDAHLLKSLFQSGIRPPFISAESHTIEVFCAMVTLGDYKAFKLVDGASVPTVYKDATIRGLNGNEVYSFPAHAAGPFGDDIHGPWFPANSFSRLLGLECTGWKDVHASNVREPDESAYPRFGKYVLQAARNRLLKKLGLWKYE